MSTTTAQRRKVPKAPGSATLDPESISSSNGTVQVATVRRRKFGTSPFDENWLNVDCCGLACACITYLLHAYAVYTVCVIMIPPWMSTKDEDGTRHLTTAGQFNQLAFTSVAIMACLSHFYAMTTNPGAVPPDAKPVQSPDETNKNSGTGDEEAPQKQKGMRLCRRCNAFKPRRAHHCRLVVPGWKDVFASLVTQTQSIFCFTAFVRDALSKWTVSGLFHAESIDFEAMYFLILRVLTCVDSFFVPNLDHCEWTVKCLEVSRFCTLTYPLCFLDVMQVLG